MRTSRNDPAAPLVAGHPGELLRAPGEVASPVLRVVLERAAAGSRPGAREDGHVVCLAIEGGGMRGAVTAGMSVLLEWAGLVAAFDRVYGVSSGALNGMAATLGQAALSVTHYEDAARRHVIRRARPLLGRPVVDFDLLFEEVITARKPLSGAGGAPGPDFRALAVSLETLDLRVLAGLENPVDALQAVRASAALPRLGGRAPRFRGERMADGGLVEPIPYASALEQGATHVLVLRSRAADFRVPAMRDLGESLALRDHPGLVQVLRSARGVYNRMAGDLEAGRAGAAHGAVVDQVTVAPGARLPARLDTRAGRVSDGARLGAGAMAAAVLTGAIDLCWQPVVYRADPLPAPAPLPAPRSDAVAGRVRRGAAVVRRRRAEAAA